MNAQQWFSILNGSANALIKWASIVVIALIFKGPMRDTLSGVAQALKSLANRRFRAGSLEFAAPEAAAQRPIDASPVAAAEVPAPAAEVPAPPNASTDPDIRNARDAIAAAAQALPVAQRQEWAFWEAASASIRAYYFQMYSLMYGSQLALLKMANAAAGAGVPDSVAQNIFQHAKSRDPQFYAAYPYESWLGFLSSTYMIVPGGAGFVLSTRGRAFLHFLVGNGLSDTGTGNNSFH